MPTQQQTARLNALQIEIHENAKNKGFHSLETSDTMLLALILGELCEGLEAFRNWKRFGEFNAPIFKKMEISFSDKDKTLFIFQFEKYIKGTLEEEFADVVIRCLDFMALKDVILKPRMGFEPFSDFEKNFWHVVKKLQKAESQILQPCAFLSQIVFFMFAWATRLGFDLMPFIELKMKYNTTRPPLHGKKF